MPSKKNLGIINLASLANLFGFSFSSSSNLFFGA
jgi:hypothetical protein